MTGDAHRYNDPETMAIAQSIAAALPRIAKAAVTTAVESPGISADGAMSRYCKSTAALDLTTRSFIVHRPDGDLKFSDPMGAAKALLRSWLEEIDRLDPKSLSVAVDYIRGPASDIANGTLKRWS